MPHTTPTEPLLIAIDDPLVHPEAVHIAAATGRPVIDADGPDALRRHYARAHAVFLDAAHSAALQTLPPRPGVFLLGSDVETIAAQHAASPGVEGAFVVPAQAGDLLRAVGALRTAAPSPHGREAVIAVLGAAGGVGASTLGAAICRAAPRELEPMLVDAHRYSGGLDLLLGIEEEIGARWGEIVLGDGSVNRADVRRALPSTRDGIAVLTHARTTINDPSGADKHEIERLVAATSGAGLTVVDSPVRLMPARCDLAVVLTPAEVRGAAAAARIVAECSAASTPAALVVRHRGWSSLESGEIARIARAEVIAQIQHAPRLPRAVEVEGLPQRLPRTLAAAARAVLEEAGL
ncbi:septum site-determining protein Ssd [Corynebacterium timonense]|uniref:Helicase/secretion neighborhood CpaE-like protein n=1 Tax=Corynebacterium timonense TaxID=441500 RepID=A0A1H1TJK6_9CORY|nr:septum site-determining protein Ssd [Corynebacterium timonense]SDS60433.1 helicase/secretion neighborhood CpaE-like protein [Corynebacterium timonense]